VWRRRDSEDEEERGVALIDREEFCILFTFLVSSFALLHSLRLLTLLCLAMLGYERDQAQ